MFAGVGDSLAWYNGLGLNQSVGDVQGRGGLIGFKAIYV